MKTPQFWHKKNLISYLLLPFSMLYLLGHFINYFRKKSVKINTPVICIGNLVAGGAGKTPVAIAIGKILQESKIDFAYLSSGYGGKIENFTFVEKEKHNAADVGDEPLLLCQIAETFICKNRLFGAQMIAKTFPKKLILMDDGLQNPSIKKDLSILVIDGNYGFGNGFLIPAGALREPVCVGIKKADLVIIVGEDKFNIAKKFCQEFYANKKVIYAKIVPINYDKFAGKSVIAFCGIGRPEKFFNNLIENKINIIAKFSYADHHQYQINEIEKMIDLAKKNHTSLITTKKDWVRLAPIHQKQIECLDIQIEFENDQSHSVILSLIKSKCRW